jgi:hypothetical protein
MAATIEIAMNLCCLPRYLPESRITIMHGAHKAATSKKDISESIALSISFRSQNFNNECRSHYVNVEFEWGEFDYVEI